MVGHTRKEPKRPVKSIWLGEPASYSFVLRGYVRHWLGNVWAEYDRINLTDIVAARAPTATVTKVQARG